MNILIATTPGREKWLSQCLASFGDIPVVIKSDFNFEIGKIRWAIENTNWERFWLFQDSVILKDKNLLELGWKSSDSVALSDHPVPYGMYLGIYERKVIEKIGIPSVKSKEDAVQQECDWHLNYAAVRKIKVLFNNFSDDYALGVEDVFGRKNLRLENEYLIKYKGTWLCGECVGKSVSCEHTSHIGKKII